VVRDIRHQQSADPKGRGDDVQPPAPLADWRDDATRQLDAELRGNWWRCPAHGITQEPAWLSDWAYCPAESCSSRLLQVHSLSRDPEHTERETDWNRKTPARRVVHQRQPREDVEPEPAVDEVDQIAAESSASGPSPEPKTEEETMPKTATYPRGALQEQFLATLAKAPERTMTYDALAASLWPGVDGAVARSRLNNVLNRLVVKGHVRRGDGRATLLITHAMPTEGVAAPSIARARQAVKHGLAPTPAAAPRAGGRAGVLVDPLRAAIQGRIEHLQALLKSLDDVEHALNEAAA
jgi:hypothetical protein